MLNTKELLWVIILLLGLIAGPVGWFILGILFGALLLKWACEGMAWLWKG
jgi:hypothetical protein